MLQTLLEQEGALTQGITSTCASLGSGMRADLLQPATSSSESEGEEDAEEPEAAGRMGGR